MPYVQFHLIYVSGVYYFGFIQFSGIFQNDRRTVDQKYSSFKFSSIFEWLLFKDEFSNITMKELIDEFVK